MAEILTTKTSLARHGRPGTFEAVRAEALFASSLQSSQEPATGDIRSAVAVTLRQIGIRGLDGARRDIAELVALLVDDAKTGGPQTGVDTEDFHMILTQKPVGWALRAHALT